jgi:hypothetical protein
MSHNKLKSKQQENENSPFPLQQSDKIPRFLNYHLHITISKQAGKQQFVGLKI